MLQQKEGIPTPTNDYEWTGLRRMCIDVRREHVLADTLREMFKPRFDTTILLKVVFVREEAADTGGPTREFWRLITEGIREKFCTGEEGKMAFERNTPALQTSVFRKLGMLLAMSALQGGPGLPIFHPAVYEYIVAKENHNPEQLSVDDVPHRGVKLLLSQVHGVIYCTSIKNQ